ncbi:MAG: DUF3185 domain-containing protein [Verrucomicrobiota bacterium]
MRLAGFILIGIGVIAFIYKGITFSHTEKDAQIGPVAITHEEKNTLPISPIVGVICLAAGVGLITTNKN